MTSSAEIVAKKLEKTSYEIDFEVYKDYADTYNVVIIRCSSDDLVYFFMPGCNAGESYHGEDFVIPGYVGVPYLNTSYSEFVREMIVSTAKHARAPFVFSGCGEHEGEVGYNVYMSSEHVPNDKFSIYDDVEFYGYGLVMSYEYLKNFMPLSHFIDMFGENQDPEECGKALARYLGY